ncbi:MAG: hypothetical protein AB8H12_04710 [Lewinella sp.]
MKIILFTCVFLYLNSAKMNTVKVITYEIFTKKYQALSSQDDELLEWKDVNAPHVRGIIFRYESDVLFLVTLPSSPVYMFDSVEDFKKFALKKRENRRVRKSSYEGLVPTEEIFLASMDANRNTLAQQLGILPTQLNYSLESITPLLEALKRLPKVHDYYAKPDPTSFLLIQYIGNTIYTQRKQKWSFRKQQKFDVLIPDIIYVGVDGTPYDWFTKLTSGIVEKRFDELPYIIEFAIGYRFWEN